MTKAIDKSHLDTGISPAEDFYHYANGGWLKQHPIPDEFSRYGTFDKLRDENREIVRDLIAEVADKASSEGAPVASLVGQFYNTGMDTGKVNRLGHKPLLKDLEKIGRLTSRGDVPPLLNTLFTEGIPSLFYLYPSPDREDAGQVIANIHQGGMGLTDVEYYRKDDPRSKEIRDQYMAYIGRMFSLTGMAEEEAEKASKKILSMETRLARAGMTRLEQRDPHRTFNKFTLTELEETCPGIQWKNLFDELRINVKGHLNVNQPAFIEELNSMLKDTQPDDWKVFFQWRLINSAANYLSDEFVEAKFDFYGRYLSGKKSLQPRWKRVTAATEDALGEAIGKLFVEKYFPPEAKTRMLELVENLRDALRERITNLDWMTGTTKKKALEKLGRIRVKIGYPDRWRSWEKLRLNNHSYYENYREAAIFNLAYELDKIGKPSDPDEWHMTPQTVNAYYHPMLNEIVFPAGILQPPFFFKDADDAVNYGAIGVVIGHEMTHGFDDQGRKFDKNGNLNDWWTEADARKFSERTRVLEEQFNRIRIVDDLYADGKLSLGENIADLGGVNIAFHALRKAWKKQPPEDETDGFTPQQRFFLAYAHVWANNIRKEEMIRLTHEDVHSLGINRVNGPLPNVQHFHEAFGVDKGDAMFLAEDQRASIW